MQKPTSPNGLRETPYISPFSAVISINNHDMTDFPDSTHDSDIHDNKFHRMILQRIFVHYINAELKIYTMTILSFNKLQEGITTSDDIYSDKFCLNNKISLRQIT